MEKKKTELQEIREAFGASREQFGKVFIGISASMIYCYEKGRYEPPESVMRIARAWKYFLDEIRGRGGCR